MPSASQKAQVQVAAIADRIQSRLGGERGAQPGLTGGLAHDFAGEHDTVRAGEPCGRPTGHLELPHAILGLEGLDPGSGVDQGRHAKIGKRSNPAHRIQRERCRPAHVFAAERELVLVGDMQLEVRFRLQVGQR